MKTKLLLLVAIVFSVATSFGQIVRMGLIGEGAGGWCDTCDIELLSTDNTNYAKANVTLTNGIAKFREIIGTNGTWNTNEISAATTTASVNFPNGTGVAGGGANVNTVAGVYNVSLNRITKVYSFTAVANPYATININNSGSPIVMATSNGTNYTAMSTTIVAGNFTFAQAGSTNVWGNPAFPAGTATQGGSPVVAPNGTYNISFNKNTGAYSFANTAVGMIGVGSPSGSWDIDAPMTTTNAINYTINNAVITAGNLKIRDNSSWTFQFGANGVNTFPMATMIPNGGDFAVIAGTYNISFNRTTGAINFASTSTASTDSFIKENFNIMPNPSSSLWNVLSKNNEITSIQIFDIVGKQVFSKNMNALDYSVDASNFKASVLCPFCLP